MTCPLPFGVAFMAGIGPAPPVNGPAKEPDDEARPAGRPSGRHPGAAGYGPSRIVRMIHAVATGPVRGQRRWTPVGLTLFAGSLAAVVFGGLATDRLFAFGPMPGGAGLRAGGMVLVVTGLALCGWCVVLFARARGTPVPVNPPEELIWRGPYAWVRNPMLTGVFAALFGVGLLLRSPSIVLLWTPVYVLLHVLELKWVEEPELERRFGVAYRAYRDSAPMFVPRVPTRRITMPRGGVEGEEAPTTERRALWLLSAVFAGLIAGGLVFVIAPDWGGIGWLNRGVDRAFFGAAAPPAGAGAMRRWLYGVEGATLVAFGVLGLAVIRTAGIRREPWVWKALASAVGAWFVLDTIVSAGYGVWPNVVLNLGIALVVLVPVVALARSARPGP